jgi:hypothetical protein
MLLHLRQSERNRQGYMCHYFFMVSGEGRGKKKLKFAVPVLRVSVMSLQRI